MSTLVILDQIPQIDLTIWDLIYIVTADPRKDVESEAQSTIR